MGGRVQVEYTKKQRLQRAAKWIMLLAVCVVMFAFADQVGEPGVMVFLRAVSFIVGVSAFFLALEAFNTSTEWLDENAATEFQLYVPEPPPAIIEEADRSKSILRKLDDTIDFVEDRWWKWYIRIPVVIALLGVALYSASIDQMLFAGVFALGAVFLLINIIFVVLFLAAFVGTVWAVFGAIAAIPVSVAVIIGAIIITYGIAKR